MQILSTCVHTFLMQVVREYVNSLQKLYAHARHVLREIRCWSLRVQRNEWDEVNYERK